MILLRTRYQAISFPKEEWSIYTQNYYEYENEQGLAYQNTTGVGDLLAKGDLVVDTPQNRFVYSGIYNALDIAQSMLDSIHAQIEQKDIFVNIESMTTQGCFLFEKLEIYSKSSGGPPVVIYPPVY